VPAASPALPSDGIWEVRSDGFAITQGSNVPYIANLNDGSSQQASAGFIDLAAQEAQDDLEDALMQIMTEIFG
jgi:hypothetical protein